MAKKFMHFEDNDDGTTTVTVNIDPEHMDDMTVVLQTGLEEMVSLFDPDVLRHVEQVTAENSVVIPNNAVQA